MDRLFEMMREPSTYRGLTWILMVFGITVTPDMTDAVMGVGLSIVGAIDVFKKD